MAFLLLAPTGNIHPWKCQAGWIVEFRQRGRGNGWLRDVYWTISEWWGVGLVVFFISAVLDGVKGDVR